MPIKVRCKECEQVMAVPDKAAGRAVKCKSCGARVAVPVPKTSSGQGEAPVRKKRKKKKKRPAAAPSFDAFDDPDDMFSNIDVRGAAHRDERVCPSCAKVVDEEDVECPFCGVNIDTGVLSVQQRERRARKGPPPEEYYGTVLKNGWTFVMNHKGFAMKTGLLWGFSATMVIISAFILNWYTRTRAVELYDSAEGDVTFTEDYVLIKPEKDTGKAEYDGVNYGPGSTRLNSNGELRLPLPAIASMLSPPTFFWAFIFLVFALSFGGWAWVLSSKVVEVTLAKQKKIKRFQGDTFANMTKGFTTLAWPVVLMYPVIWVPIAMYFAGVSQMACIITFIAIFLLPYFIFLPNALVHMSQPYSYRAWLITWMGKDWLNTLVPSMFTSALFVGLVLAVPLGIAAGIAVGWDQFATFYMEKVELPAIGSVFSYQLTDADLTSTVAFKRLPFMFAISWLSCTLLFTILAFPAIMMMRIFGLFALYFREDMDVCVEQVPMSPAGFGPRFLAIQVDAIIAALMCVVAVWAASFLAGLFAHLYNSESIRQPVFIAGSVIGILVALSFYFANWESGSGRATLGKWSFGMLVLREDNQPMTFKQAIQRFFASLLTILSLGITFIMCLFHPNYRAVHDTITKTKVVWRGDENM